MEERGHCCDGWGAGVCVRTAILPNPAAGLANMTDNSQFELEQYPRHDMDAAGDYQRSLPPPGRA